MNIILKILTLALFTAQPGVAAEPPLIAVNQFVNHAALDDAARGLQEALTSRGILPGKARWVLDNAQGSITSAAQIAKHQASQQPAFMVGIATPSAQASLKARPEGTIVAFLAVTDPVAAGLGAKGVIGIADAPPLDALLDAMTALLPQVKTLGILYNPGEINSVKTLEKMQALALARGIRIETALVHSTTHIKTALLKLIPEVQAIYVPQDNTVFSALGTVIRSSKKAKIPVLTNVPSTVKDGALLAFGCDYFQSGKELGDRIADEIEHKTSTTEGIQLPQKQSLAINRSLSAEWGLSVPDALLRKSP